MGNPENRTQETYQEQPNDFVQEKKRESEVQTEEIKDQEGRASGRIEKTLDSQGRIIKQEVKDMEGNMTMEKKFTYNQKGSIEKEITKYGEKSLSIVENLYDKQSRLIEKRENTFYEGLGETGSTREKWKYGIKKLKNGNTIESTTHATYEGKKGFISRALQKFRPGNFKEKYYEARTIDKDGNWLGERRTHTTRDESGEYVVGSALKFEGGKIKESKGWSSKNEQNMSRGETFYDYMGHVGEVHHKEYDDRKDINDKYREWTEDPTGKVISGKK